MDYIYTPENNPKPHRWSRWAMFAGIAIVFFMAVKWSGLGSATITVVNRITGSDSQSVDENGNKIVKIADDPQYKMPENDKNRLDIEWNNLVSAKERLDPARTQAVMALSEANQKVAQAQEPPRKVPR